MRVCGAREHNLKNVDADIPPESLVVFIGVSGSGKSSLAFGTLYAEAQRRYLESVSSYARRLFHQMAAPEVDEVEGLSPAVTEELFEAFDRMRHEVAMIIVDHHLDLALALSDRTVVLERGSVSWTGTSQMLKDDLALRRKILWM